VSAVNGAPDTVVVVSGRIDGPVYLRVTVGAGAKCRFGFSLDGTEFKTINPDAFAATVSRWVGAKVGLFASGNPRAAADFSWCRVQSP
jgi:hypothetical protein